MSYLLEREQYARIYGCAARSIGNYERDNAPLDEPEAMYHWLCQRRSQPAGFAAKTVEEIASAYAWESSDAGELASILREEIRELMHSIDIDQLRVRCKIMAAERAGCNPDYAPTVTAAMGKILAGVKDVFGVFGLEPDDTRSDSEEEDELADSD